MTTTATAGIDRTIAVINGKGGTFKSSITASLGGMLAAAGAKVLIVDFDPQGNQTEQLGLAELTDDGDQMLSALPSSRPLEAVSTGRDRLDIAFGGHYLKDLAALLGSRQGRDQRWMHALADSLASTAADYDVVIIDCPPGIEVLQKLALVAARYALIPTKSDPMSRKGMREVAALFQAVHEGNPDLELLGVVRTGSAAGSTAIRAAARADIEGDLGGAAPVLETCIRQAEAAARDALNSGQLPFELEPALANQKPYWQQVKEGAVERGLPPSTTGLAQDYAELTQEVIDLIEAAEDRAAGGAA